jgi:hypothetical protein
MFQLTLTLALLAATITTTTFAASDVSLRVSQDVRSVRVRKLNALLLVLPVHVHSCKLYKDISAPKCCDGYCSSSGAVCTAKEKLLLASKVIT